MVVNVALTSNRPRRCDSYGKIGRPPSCSGDGRRLSGSSGNQLCGLSPIVRRVLVGAAADESRAGLLRRPSALFHMAAFIRSDQTTERAIDQTSQTVGI